MRDWVTALFDIRLIGFTAGTLVYLFLLALILGHRRPRLFERVLFFLVLSLFLIYAGGLLEINAQIQYGSVPNSTRLLYTLLRQLGVAFLPALLVHFQVSYLRTIRGRKIPRWCGAIVWIFYLLPFMAVLGNLFVLRGLFHFSFPILLTWIAKWSVELTIPAVLAA